MTDHTEIVKAHLANLAEAHGGKLTPEIVVDDARNEDSPLHDLFDWNAERAAMQYWLDRARQIIRSVRVVFRNERTIVRAPFYVRDPTVPNDEQGYISLAEVRGKDDVARDVLLDEFNRAAAALRRAREVAAALDMTAEIDHLMSDIVGLRERVMQAPETRQ
jgi:hypothetical protein